MSTKRFSAFPCPPIPPEPLGISPKTRKPHSGKLIETVYIGVFTGPKWDKKHESLDYLRTELCVMGTELGGVNQLQINGALLSALFAYPSN